MRLTGITRARATNLSAAARAYAILLLLLVPVIGSAPVAAEGVRPELSSIVALAADSVIIPSFSAFADESAKLAVAMRGYCDNQGADFVNVQSAFRDTIVAWAAVDFYRFGPLADQGRRLRIAFLPDPRGIVYRQLRRAIPKADEALLQPELLARKSAGLQGLTALELLLRKPEQLKSTTGQEAGYRCRYATAIAHNVANIAQQLQVGWTGSGGWRETITTPGPRNTAYRSDKESAAELVKALLLALDAVRDQQITPLLNQVSGGKVARLPFRHSHLSSLFLDRQLKAAVRLFEALRLSNYIPDNQRWLKQWFETAKRDLVAAAAEIGQVPDTANLDYTSANTIRKLRFYANGIRSMVARYAAPEAGLTIGFNELDGD